MIISSVYNNKNRTPVTGIPHPLKIENDLNYT